MIFPKNKLTSILEASQPDKTDRPDRQKYGQTDTCRGTKTERQKINRPVDRKTDKRKDRQRHMNRPADVKMDIRI